MRLSFTVSQCTMDWMCDGCSGRIECVDILLKSGCNPAVACNGVPVLHLAMTFAAFPHKRAHMMDILECLLDSDVPLTAT